MKTTQLLSMSLAMFAASPATLAAQAPEAEQAQGADAVKASTELQATDALLICQSLFSNFGAAKAGLDNRGWTAPEREVSPVYEEEGSTTLVRGDMALFFLGANNSIGKDRLGFEGICQIAMPGNSVIAATQIAAKAGFEATSFRDEVGDLFNSIRFQYEGNRLEIASINEENTAMRLQYGPM